MRVTFGTDGSLTPNTGMNNRAVSLANTLVNRDIDVSFFTFIKKRDDIDSRVRIVEYTPFNLSYNLFYNASERFFSKFLFPTLIAKQIRKLRPDIFCVDYPPMDRYAVRLRDYLHFKLLYTYHTVTDPSLYLAHANRLKLRRYEKHVNQVAARADIVIAVSNFAKRYLIERNIESSLLYNGVDTDFFRPNPCVHLDPALIYVGRLVEHKGVHMLIDSFKKVKKEVPRARLYLVGSCEEIDYYNKLKKLARDQRDSIFFLGDVNMESLHKCYMNADIFVCTSMWEGFGMPFLEAQSCGIPCVGFDTTAIPEVVVNGKTGILVEKGDTEAIANAVIELLANVDLRKKMGVAAREQAEKFDWRIIADQFLKIIKV